MKPIIALISLFPLFCSITLATPLLPDTEETPRMKEWRDLKYGMFLHFGMSTFTGNEHDPGQAPSGTYAPPSVDADQWMRVASEAGMKYAVLTAKHVSGHCLWDSKVMFRGKEYDYDVATSGNKTDVVGAFVEACRKYNIKPGLYYCLLDYRNNTVPQKEQWEKFQLPEDFFQLAVDQLTELVTNYPAVGIYWLDIPRAASEEQRAALYDLLRSRNPGAVVLFNQGWRKGREDPLTIESTQGHTWPSDVLNTEREVFFPPFSPKQSWRGKTYYLGYEHCDTLGKDWFWTADDKPRKIDELAKLYQSTRGAGGNLLLNVGPDRNGKLQDWQIEALMKLKQRIQPQP